MSARRSIPEPLPITTYIEEGARIAAILVVWSILGVVASLLFSIAGISLLWIFGAGLGYAFALAGALNALLYVAFRSIDYWSA